MHPPEKDNKEFITDRGIYCYKKMPFGLKNVGATFQLMVNKVFRKLIGQTMKVYINDMLVKSHQSTNHVQHLS